MSLPLPRRREGSARRDRLDEARTARADRLTKTAAPRLKVVPEPGGDPPPPRHQRDLPVPEPLPTRAQLAGAARYRAAMAKVHARNSHRHAGQVARWAGAGATRTWAWWWDLATAPDHRALSKAASKAGDKKGRDGHRDCAQRSAFWAALAAGAAMLPAIVFVGLAGKRLGILLYLAAAVAVLAAVGRRPGQTLPPAAPEAKGPALTPDVILKAFKDAGHPDAATVGAPSIEGKGLNRRLRVIVDLSSGRDQTATAAIKKREHLAGNLRRDMKCVYLAQGGHAGQVILTVLDQDPMAGPPVPSPLLAMPEWSLWDAIPWGFDIRGKQVFLPLLWTSLLVGAKPRMGKTFAIRTIVLAAILDRHCRVYLWDGKGAGDYKMFRSLCAWFGQGHNPKKGQPAECLKMLREVSRLVDERNEKIDRLPTHLRPQGKLTREVSRDPKYGLPLILVVVSELQRMLADDKHGPDIRNELIALAQNAPSCGVIVVVDAQRPTQTTGKGSLGDLPPAMGSRAAFKVMDAGESNVILGDGMAGAGWDSSIFPDDYEGVCLLRSGADVAEGPKGVQQVKTFYADDMMLEAKCAEIVAARGGETVPASGGLVALVGPSPAVGARERLLAVLEDGEDRCSVKEWAARLDVDTAAVWEMARTAEVEVKRIRGPWNGTEWGVYRAQFEG